MTEQTETKSKPFALEKLSTLRGELKRNATTIFGVATMALAGYCAQKYGQHFTCLISPLYAGGSFIANMWYMMCQYDNSKGRTIRPHPALIGNLVLGVALIAATSFVHQAEITVSSKNRNAVEQNQMELLVGEICKGNTNPDSIKNDFPVFEANLDGWDGKWALRTRFISGVVVDQIKGMKLVEVTSKEIYKGTTRDLILVRPSVNGKCASEPFTLDALKR